MDHTDEKIAQELQRFYGEENRRSLRNRKLPLRFIEVQSENNNPNSPAVQSRRQRPTIGDTSTADDSKSSEMEVDEEPKSKPPKKKKKNDESGMSAYEQLIMKNIEERKLLFEKFKIQQAKEDLTAVSTPVKKPVTHRTPARGFKVKKERSEEEHGPVRHSARLLERTAGAGRTPLKPEEDYSRGLDGDLSYPAKKEPSYKQLDERKAYSLAELYANADDQSEKEEEVKTFLAKITNNLGNIGSGKGMGALSLENFKQNISKFDVAEEHLVKITKDRIYSIAVHPSESRRLIVAGDRSGNVGLWAVDDTGDKHDGCRIFYPHREPVNCVSFDRYNPTKFYSTSYDGLVKRADLESGIFEPVYMTDPKSFKRNWTSYHVQKDANIFYIGQGDGNVAVIDLRTSGNQPKAFGKCYEISVKTVDMHPLQNDIITTSSRTGIVGIFDVRKFSDHADRNRLLKPIGKFQHQRVAHSAFFSPVTGDYILSSSADDTIQVHDVTDLSNPDAVLSLKHNNHVGRWITPFHPIWHPQREDVFVTGSMSGYTGQRQVEVFQRAVSRYTS